MPLGKFSGAYPFQHAHLPEATLMFLCRPDFRFSHHRFSQSSGFVPVPQGPIFRGLRCALPINLIVSSSLLVTSPEVLIFSLDLLRP